MLLSQGFRPKEEGAFNAPGLLCPHRDFITDSVDSVSPAHKLIWNYSSHAFLPKTEHLNTQISNKVAYRLTSSHGNDASPDFKVYGNFEEMLCLS